MLGLKYNILSNQVAIFKINSQKMKRRLHFQASSMYTLSNFAMLYCTIVTIMLKQCFVYIWIKNRTYHLYYRLPLLCQDGHYATVGTSL